MILFKPSFALSATNESNKNARGVASATRTLVLSLLKRIQELDIHKYTIGKFKECLNRIVIGLSHNTTVEAGHILPFVYISVSPFVSGGKTIESNKKEEEPNDSEIELKSNIKISRTDKSQSANKKEGNKKRINTSFIYQ